MFTERHQPHVSLTEKRLEGITLRDVLKGRQEVANRGKWYWQAKADYSSITTRDDLYFAKFRQSEVSRDQQHVWALAEDAGRLYFLIDDRAPLAGEFENLAVIQTLSPDFSHMLLEATDKDSKKTLLLVNPFGTHTLKESARQYQSYYHYKPGGGISFMPNPNHRFAVAAVLDDQVTWSVFDMQGLEQTSFSVPVISLPPWSLEKSSADFSRIIWRGRDADNKEVLYANDQLLVKTKVNHNISPLVISEDLLSFLAVAQVTEAENELNQIVYNGQTIGETDMSPRQFAAIAASPDLKFAAISFHAVTPQPRYQIFYITPAGHGFTKDCDDDTVPEMTVGESSILVTFRRDGAKRNLLINDTTPVSSQP